VSSIKEKQNTKTTKDKKATLGGLLTAETKANTNSVISKCAESVLAQTQNKKRRRKRRSTSLTTCEMIQQNSDNLVTLLSTADITALDTTEFNQCYATLGDSSYEWSSDQLNALEDKLKTVKQKQKNNFNKRI
jgi:hypothetical protein